MYYDQLCWFCLWVHYFLLCIHYTLFAKRVMLVVNDVLCKSPSLLLILLPSIPWVYLCYAVWGKYWSLIHSHFSKAVVWTVCFAVHCRSAPFTLKKKPKMFYCHCMTVKPEAWWCALFTVSTLRRCVAPLKVRNHSVIKHLPKLASSVMIVFSCLSVVWHTHTHTHTHADAHRSMFDDWRRQHINAHFLYFCNVNI